MKGERFYVWLAEKPSSGARDLFGTMSFESRLATQPIILLPSEGIGSCYELTERGLGLIGYSITRFREMAQSLNGKPMFVSQTMAQKIANSGRKLGVETVARQRLRW